jgi:hypothetical protein
MDDALPASNPRAKTAVLAPSNEGIHCDDRARDLHQSRIQLGALLKDFESRLETGTVSAALVLLASGFVQAARRRRRLEGDITLSWAAISAVLPFVWRAT